MKKMIENRMSVVSSADLKSKLVFKTAINFTDQK